MELSVTKIKDYKMCKRLYELKYLEKIKPVKDSEALINGRSYHDKLEQLYTKGYFDFSGDITDAMAFAYEKFIYPEFSMCYVEDWFDYKLNDNHTLIGRIDGITSDKILVEHKTTSRDVDESYIYNLQWDEQILSYMLANNTRKIYYTVCKKPTIRKKKNESDEDFINRCCNWYNEDTEKKIGVFMLERTDEEIEKHKKNLIYIADEMEDCSKHKEKLYNNPCACSMWGSRCPYSSICLNYQPDKEYIGFVKEIKEEKKEDELF